ncbi:MAG: hypothetical protein LH603_07500 [Pseudonocardia sp.]|nr:hypothetical protein [Pseudonocardia sp.]
MSNEHTTTPDSGGFVPRLGADPSSARYELLTAADAVQRVVAVGFDRADAELMVEQYLAQSTAEFGTPAGDGWRVDPYDLAEIARGYEWVDHYRGETIADARARAAEYASGYQQQGSTMDREQDPGYAAEVDREAVEWADRARDGHNPWPFPDPRLATAEGTFGELTEDEERAEIEAVNNAVGDDEPRTAEQAAHSAQVISVSWAIAARDIAIERGDTTHAIRFAHDAREAITAAEVAGITRAQLAAELDYPGGAAELDGEHIGIGIDSGEPMTAAQLAGLDAAFGGSREHPDDIWGSVPPGLIEMSDQIDRDLDSNNGYTNYTVDQAVERLTPVLGAETAAAQVREYLTERHGRPEPYGGILEPAELFTISGRVTPTLTDDTSDGDHHGDGDGDEDGDGGVRGRDDGPRPVPLSGPDAAPRDEAADTHGDPGATVTREDDRAEGLRDEAGAGRDDPAGAVWWAPNGPREVTLSHREVEEELTERGFTPDQARAAITDYLDQTSREVGVSVHRWGLDSHDVEAITHTHAAGRPVELPEQRGPAARSEWDQVRGDDRRSYDQMMGDAAAALTARPAVPAMSTDVEDERRDQLIRWHTDDHTRARADGDGRDDAPVRALDDFAPTGATTLQEW